MKINGTIQKIMIHRYDGFITVITDKMTYKYEGTLLCPKKVLSWMQQNPDKCVEVNSFGII